MDQAAAIDFAIARQALDILDVAVLEITEAHKICTTCDLANNEPKHLETLLCANLPSPDAGSIIHCPETDVLHIETLAYWL